MITTAVVLALLIVALVYFITLYNGFVALRENVKKAWSNIDVLLTQRHDELPKLVEICKRYMQHERETLEAVMRARAAVHDAQDKGDIPGLGEAETGLRQGLSKLLAVAEAYPNLKADEMFQNLQRRVSQLEESIADRREFYNDSVNVNNVRVDQLPDLLVARSFGFARADLLEFSEEQTSDVDLAKLFV